MKTSKKGVELIKKFEGVRLKSYKPVSTEEKYTIGYGHYGVLKNLTITQKKADEYLAKDIAKAEKEVNKYMSGKICYKFNQNEYDALVCFTYNIGTIKQLTKNGTRTKKQIGDAMLLYVNSSGKKLKGLVTRREAEHKLYTTAC